MAEVTWWPTWALMAGVVTQVSSHSWAPQRGLPSSSEGPLIINNADLESSP